LESITITSRPTKTAYVKGEVLDLSGLVVTGTYSDGTTRKETVSLANISGYNADTIGQQTLTVTVDGKTAQFTVTVNAVGAPTLSSIVVTTPPTKTTYDIGDHLDLAGLVLTGTYSDGNTKVETVTTADVNGYDKNTVGGQELTVTVNGKTAQFSVTVNADPIDDIADSLANAQGGATAANPVPLAVSVNLANGGWEKILSAIGNTGKYVALDLSACSMTGTEFNPGIGNAGADKVAVLTLPDAAKSIKAGTSYPTYNATFKDFTALESISGAGVETIGNYAFDGCTSLKTVSFSTAITIGEWGFNRCENLASVNLPAVQTLGGSYVFSECVSLTSLSFPSATSIGARAFDQCTSLTEVNLPAAATIGYGAFYYCSSLTSVNLPATPPSIASIGGSGLFAYTGSTGTITVSIPADALRAYTSAWGVTVNTAANGNQYVYGSDHKAVRIPGDAFLQRIEINSLPTKTVYLVGEALDLTGLVVIGIYSDGTTKQETVSLSDVTGYNADEIAEQILTVTVRDKTATLTTTFRVSVNVVIHASINFDNPINGAPENIVLSRAGMPSSITIEITGTYADYEWRLNDNDEPVSRTASYTLNAADCLLGTNFLDVQVRTTAGAYYSKEITFTVNR
jgi:hypothetical protein